MVERGGSRFLRTYYHGERRGGWGRAAFGTDAAKLTGAIDLRAVAVAVGVVGEEKGEGEEGVEDEGAEGRGKR